MAVLLHIQNIPPALAALAGSRDLLPTDEAALVLNRQKQTLRKWAAFDCGPIRPVRINGRLGWRVVDIARLLNGEAGCV